MQTLLGILTALQKTRISPNSIIRENIMLGTCISQVPFYILLELESMQEGDSLHCR